MADNCTRRLLEWLLLLSLLLLVLLLLLMSLWCSLSPVALHAHLSVYSSHVVAAFVVVVVHAVIFAIVSDTFSFVASHYLTFSLLPATRIFRSCRLSYFNACNCCCCCCCCTLHPMRAPSRYILLFTSLLFMVFLRVVHILLFLDRSLPPHPTSSHLTPPLDTTPCCPTASNYYISSSHFICWHCCWWCFCCCCCYGPKRSCSRCATSDALRR